MPTYDNPVTRSKKATHAFADEIDEDLDPAVGGINWWANYQLGDDTLAELSHYAGGAVRAIATNLDEAALHFYEYQKRITAEDIFLNLKLRQGNGTLTHIGERREIDRRRDAEINAHQTAFFRSIGSALDTLTSVTIVVGALDLDVLRATFAMLATADTTDTYPHTPGKVGSRLRKAMTSNNEQGVRAQEQFLRGIRGSINAAGPPGWVLWALEVRNSFVHRPRWLKTTMYEASRAGGTFVRPLPRTPGRSEGSALRSAAALTDTFLVEDALTTMRGILESTDALIAAHVEQCSSLWKRRRANPYLLPQPGTQWSTPALQDAFNGYDPESARKAFDKSDALLVNPSDARRLTALTTGQQTRSGPRAT